MNAKTKKQRMNAVITTYAIIIIITIIINIIIDIDIDICYA